MAIGVWISLGLYFALMLAIGYYAYRNSTSSSEEYILGGRKLPPAVAALSAGASDMSGWLLMGLPGAIFVAGISESWIAIGLVIGAYLNWLFVAGRLRVQTEHTGTALLTLDGNNSAFSGTLRLNGSGGVTLGSGANASVLMSKNGGVDWTRGGDRLASELHDRCIVDEEGRAFTLSRMNDGRRIVLSQGPGAPPQVAALGPAEEEIAGISCDQSALVAALELPAEHNGLRPVRLRLCPFRRPCQDMILPALGEDKLYYPVDVARVGGDTVLARSSGGITRVASSRDDGRSWTPWIVAFDALSAGTNSPAPFRLLVVGDDLLLYSGAEGGGAYPLLTSADHGASFRAPAASRTDNANDSSALAARL